MSLISLAVTLVVIGVLLWLVNTYIPMDGKIKKILNVVVVVCVVVWLLFAFGILITPATSASPGLGNPRKRLCGLTRQATGKSSILWTHSKL